jgi:hypothetical protein
MRARIQEAEEAFAAADGSAFIPLVIPDGRPSFAALAPFLGVWKGRRETVGGVDMDLTLTIRQDGDSILVEVLQVGPQGGSFGGPMMVLDADGRGGIELGTQMRGGVGMEVAELRFEGRDRLTGSVEIRGFRIPSGATRPEVVIEVRRVGGPGAVPPGEG